MSIKTSDISNKDFGTEIAKGVYAKCQSVYGWDIVENDEVFGEKVDYGFTVGFDTEIEKSDGTNYIRKKTWAGNWKKDAQGVVSGWGKLYGLGLFFKSAGVEVEVTDNGRINPKQLAPLKGKKLWRVEYVNDTYEDKEGNTKPSYAMFNTFFPEDTPIEKIKQVWENSLAKGYPNNYRPDILGNGEFTKASDGASKSTSKDNWDDWGK